MTSSDHDSSRPKLEIMDGTLRERMFGVSFVVGEKLAIASQLDTLGISFIESPAPNLNPKEVEYLKQLGSVLKKSAQPVVFVSDEEDVGKIPESVKAVSLRANCSVSRLALLSPKKPRLLEDNLESIGQRISNFRKEGKTVFFDAQHFFEAFRENPSYSFSVLENAVEAGASRLVLCDSRGASLPEVVEKATKLVRDHFSSRPDIVIGIHAHNDSGMAIPCTLAAVAGGARYVYGTINGIGERAGNADLCTLLPLLILKLGYHCLNTDLPAHEQLLGLKAISENVAIASGVSNVQQPFVGERAFAHTDPSHIKQVERNPESYEVLNPEIVGNSRKMGVDDASLVINEMWQLGLYAKDREVVGRKVLARMRELEAFGYKFDNAKASLHLLILETIGSDIRPFEVVRWETSTSRAINRASEVSGTIEVRIGEGEKEKKISARAKGVGPIHAIDLALREALDKEFPELKSLKLVSYSLNIVDSLSGTAAAARARTEFMEEEANQSWATVAVSDDVLDASIRSLIDGYRYKLIFRSKNERFTIPDWRVALGERYSERR
jgi:2-isopropylmalate synthase